jgi:hypothetical protein
VSVIARTTGLAVPAAVYFAAVALAMIAVALMIQAGPTAPASIFANSLALAATAMFALAPVYPWYFCWLVPFLCFVPSPPVIWMTSAAFILYWASARDVLWMADVFYGGAIVTAAADFARHLYVRPPMRSLA